MKNSKILLIHLAMQKNNLRVNNIVNNAQLDVKNHELCSASLLLKKYYLQNSKLFSGLYWNENQLKDLLTNLGFFFHNKKDIYTPDEKIRRCIKTGVQDKWLKPYLPRSGYYEFI